MKKIKLIIATLSLVVVGAVAVGCSSQTKSTKDSSSKIATVAKKAQATKKTEAAKKAPTKAQQYKAYDKKQHAIIAYYSSFVGTHYYTSEAITPDDNVALISMTRLSNTEYRVNIMRFDGSADTTETYTMPETGDAQHINFYENEYTSQGLSTLQSGTVGPSLKGPMMLVLFGTTNAYDAPKLYVPEGLSVYKQADITTRPLTEYGTKSQDQALLSALEGVTITPVADANQSITFDSDSQAHMTNQPKSASNSLFIKLTKGTITFGTRTSLTKEIPSKIKYSFEDGIFKLDPAYKITQRDHKSIVYNKQYHF
ncbi:hypothetical protein [Lacticaseibacillus daqingensis]|uniref:hypothetical protein n=1 Tax=Lacticaseibacillus daqingensis TaxID=2486014 RepID=UPI000F79A3B9|nr:hypothetical protein [Lacticaseibacillus daqingensis]